MATVRSISYMEIRDQTDHAENIMRGGYLKQLKNPTQTKQNQTSKRRQITQAHRGKSKEEKKCCCID